MSDLPKRNPDSIFNQIEDVLLEAWDAGFAHGYGDGTQPGRSQYPTGEQIAKIRRSEAAHLWREAMKPEVIAAMSKALWVADDKPGVGHGSDGYHMEAEHHIRLVLNLITGPRPAEQENE